MPLPKQYNSKETEAKWRDFWTEHEIYKFNPDSNKLIYSIDTPPPYASADHLHVGHVMHYSQFEFMARYYRMKGYNVFFPIGFDDNGLPTEKYVEKKYNIEKGKLNMSRQEFRELCLKETERIEEENIKPLFTNLGFSCDWNLFYRTINRHCQTVAQKSFLDLYEKGHCYRGNEPTLWCTHHQTALAQAEVEDLERETNLNYIYFELEGGGKVVIATTRPELLCSCVGIFVHPEDERYRDLVGKNAIVPIFKHKVPIMKDELVDKEFGSGIVMICTFGDTTDIEWWKKHKLPLRVSIKEDGTLNELAGKYGGMNAADARKQVILDLKESGVLFKQEKQKQVVGACWRCDTPVEFVVTEQWFIKTLELKDKLIEQGRKINWYPAFYRIRYENWVENLAWDWCISRQRHYGIPIPVWYCKNCNKIFVAREEDMPLDPETEKCPAEKCECGSADFIPEKDVFDTWMTSSMTPEIASQWKSDDKIFNKIFPMSMRPQAHDIIRTWAFYTILKAYLHENTIPWKDVMMSGHGLDEQGKKMSKSKGNVVLPEAMIEKYNIDSIRYWAASVKLGDDLPFMEKDIKTGNIILTKLWNSARFVEMNLPCDIDFNSDINVENLRLIDKWILTGLSSVISGYHEHFREYQITKAKKIVVRFFKNEFCDNYLELIKYRFYGDNEQSRYAAQWTSYHVLLGILKLLSPFMPFITEEIYQAAFKKDDVSGVKSIHITRFPESAIEDLEAQDTGEFTINIIAALRKYKSDNGMSMNAEINKVCIYTENDISPVADDISGVMNIKKLGAKKGKPEIREKIVNVIPDFAKLGPRFGKDTNRVAGFLKNPEIAHEVEEKGILEVEGVVLKKEYIFKIEREVTSSDSGERVEIIEDKGFILKITK